MVEGESLIKNRVLYSIRVFPTKYFFNYKEKNSNITMVKPDRHHF